MGIGGHTGQFVSVIPPLPTAGFPGAAFREAFGEIGGEIAYDRFLSDQTTLGISGSYHAGSMSVEEFGRTATSSTHSFTVRVGGDRFSFIDDRVAIYAGPGVFFRRGRWKSKAVDTTTEGPDATELGLNGRIGVYALGLFVQVGQNFSHPSGRALGEELSWWSGSPEGSLGLAFDF